MHLLVIILPFLNLCVRIPLLVMSSAKSNVAQISDIAEPGSLKRKDREEDDSIQVIPSPRVSYTIILTSFVGGGGLQVVQKAATGASRRRAAVDGCFGSSHDGASRR